jgi:hypothetical protein
MMLIFRDIGFSDFIHRPGIKKQSKEKHDVSETGSVSVLRWGKKPILLSPLERLDQWSLKIIHHRQNPIVTTYDVDA